MPLAINRHGLSGPFVEVEGYDYILMVICRFSGMVHIIPTNTRISAKEVARIYVKEVIRLHGILSRPNPTHSKTKFNSRNNSYTTPTQPLQNSDAQLRHNSCATLTNSYQLRRTSRFMFIDLGICYMSLSFTNHSFGFYYIVAPWDN